MIIAMDFLMSFNNTEQTERIDKDEQLGLRNYRGVTKHMNIKHI